MGAKSFTGSYFNRVNRRQNGDLRRHAPEQRVPVWRRPGDVDRRQRTARADAIFDHELLLEDLTEPLSENAGHPVGIAASGKRYDHPHRPLRPIRSKTRLDGGPEECGHREVGKDLSAVAKPFAT